MVSLDQDSVKIAYPKRVIEDVPFCNQLEVIEKLTLNDTLGTKNYNSHSPPKNYKQNTYAAAVATAAAIQQQNLALQHQAQKQSQINNQRSNMSEGSGAYKKEGNNYNSHLYQQNYRNHQDHQSLQNISAIQNFQKHKNSPYIQPSSDAAFGMYNLYNNLGNLNTQLFTDSSLPSNRPIDLKNNRLLFNNDTKSTESPVYMDTGLGQDQYQLNNTYENSNLRTTGNTSPKKLLVSTSDIGITPQSNTSLGTPTSNTVPNFLDSSLMPQVGSFTSGNWNTTSSIWGSPSSVAFSAGSSINTENGISNNFGRTSNMW